MPKENEEKAQEPKVDNSGNIEERLAEAVFKSQNFGKSPDAEELAETKSKLNEPVEKDVAEEKSKLDELYDKKEAKTEGQEEIRQKIKVKELEYEALVKEVGYMGPFWEGFFETTSIVGKTALKWITFGKINLDDSPGELEKIRKIEQLEEEIELLKENLRN